MEMESLCLEKLNMENKKPTQTNPSHFNPVTQLFSPDTLRQDLRHGLLQTAPSFVALQFLPEPESVNVDEEQIEKQIRLQVDHEEIVQASEVYSISEIAQMFLAEKGIRVLSQPTKEVCSDFFEFLQMHYFDTDMIYKKTLKQCESDFWFCQRAGISLHQNFIKFDICENQLIQVTQLSYS